MQNTAQCGCPSYALSRRGFLAGVTAATGAFATTGLFGSAFRQVSYGANPDGNILVVLSLRGGSDGLSIVVPRGDEHDQLVSWRPGIAVPEGQLIGGNAQFGLHPALSPLLPMWNAQKFGAIQATGLSVPNRSHFDAMELVERANPGSAERVGWINRAIGLDVDALPEEQLQLGSNMLPTHLQGPAAALGAYSVSDFQLSSHWMDTDITEARRQAWAGNTSLLARGVNTALDVVDRMADVAETDLDPVLAQFPDGELRSVMANTAVLIKSGASAKVIAIDYGDWDMHAGLGTLGSGQWMNDHLGHLAASIKAFFDFLGAEWTDKVTLVTISEFGRRVEENGDHGVDHGYGNAMLLVGGGVTGGQVHGTWPGLAEEQLVDGDLAVTTDYRHVLWEVLASRFPNSVSAGDKATVFPGLSGSSPVNCMA